jgi:hypothetical protein
MWRHRATMTASHSGQPWRAVFFLLGLAISVTMLIRSQVSGDPLSMLARGWLLADKGRWVAYGMETSAGGNSPGGLTSLLVGLPLFFWHDYRAPVVLILLSHMVAYFLLDRLVRETLGTPYRLVFCVLYWLSPWRMYFSAHVANTNYLFFFGALHAWTSYRLRLQPRFWASFLHICAVALPFQLHSSGFVLPVVTGLLLWRRALRLDYRAVACAAVLVAVSLVPWLLDAIHNPAILPGGSKGFPLRGLLFVFPLSRGILYWLRYASLAVCDKMIRFDFPAFPGFRLGSLVTFILSWLTEIVVDVSVIPALCASVWLWSRIRKRNARGFQNQSSRRMWLEQYVAWTFVGAVICFCLSPTTFMFWQGLVFFHAAVLPLVLWVTPLLHGRAVPRVRMAARAWVTACILILLAIAFRSPMYQPPGHDTRDVLRVADDPMLHDLGITDADGVVIVRGSGWEADVLRPVRGR